MSVIWFAVGGGEAAKSGPMALAVILVLVIACYFLFRSMSRHLKKVRQGFPVDSRRGTAADSDAAADDETPNAAPPTSAPPPA
jgi:hypothetical protein